MASAGTITAKMMRRASGRQNSHRQVGGEENKRKTKRAPGGMETKDGDRQLNQIVAGGDDQQMK